MALSVDESLIDELRRRKALADNYYDNHQKSVQNGDLGKASEFLWGAINNLTYSLGRLDGLTLGDHGKVVDYLETLAGNDKEMAEGVTAAETLHANFFHNFMGRGIFDSHKAKADILIERLASIRLQRLREIGIQGL